MSSYPPISHRHGTIKLPKAEPIRTIESLCEHLQSALAVELSTIPLYLTGTWTVANIDGPDFKDEYPKFPTETAPKLIGHVVHEEMLHLALVGNILRGLDRTPLLYDKRVIPEFPLNMLGRKPDLLLQIRPCTQEVVRDIFAEVEKPEKKYAPPEAEDYETLGQFYAAIREGIDYLNPLGTNIFDLASQPFQFSPDGDPIWGPEPGEPAAGGLAVVMNAETADGAIKTIVVQGEGDVDVRTAGEPEPNHYEIFQKLGDSTSTKPWTPAINIVTNPKTSEYTDPVVRQISATSDAAYCLLLITIQTLYGVDNPDKRTEIIEKSFFPVMKMVGQLAAVLMKLPIPTADPHSPQEFAAACFNYHAYSHDLSATEQFKRELEAAMTLAAASKNAIWTDLNKIWTSPGFKGLVNVDVPPIFY